MYDAEQRMKEIMEAPQLSAVEKIKLYFDQLNRFLLFKNKMAHSSPGFPAQNIPQVPAVMPQPNESVEITPPVLDFPKSAVHGSWKRRTFVTRKRAKFTGAFLLR
jgi:hypothetical protein